MVVKPLDGIRVLDVTQIVSGPTCTFLLAALGAEVIRVEPPGGDVTWKPPPSYGPGGVNRGPRGPRDLPLSPLRRQRGKRSVVIDLKKDEGQALFKRLAGLSDVLVENARPGVMQRLGLDYAALSSVNRRLVYASISGYGHDGPYRDRPSMDLVVQSESGLLAKTGFPDGPPTKVGVTIGDQVPGIYAALGILAALRQRERDGRGQWVDVAMLDALVALIWDEPLDEFQALGLPERSGNTDPRGAPLNVFPTADGWAAIVVTSDSQWEKLRERMRLGDRFEAADRTSGNPQRREEINRIVAEWTRVRSTAELIDELTRIGVPCGAVGSAWSAREHPQVAHRGMLERLPHPDTEQPAPFLGPGLPIRFSRAERGIRPAEPLGTSTDAVLGELLGLDPDELRGLHERGVIAGPGE